MSYRAGTHGLSHIGLPDGDPRIICDDCGNEKDVRSSRGMGRPYAWFLHGKAAPGWTGGRKPEGGRWDKCPACGTDINAAVPRKE